MLGTAACTAASTEDGDEEPFSHLPATPTEATARPEPALEQVEPEAFPANDSFETSRELRFGHPDGSSDTISRAGEEDYFHFDGVAGQYVSLSTRISPGQFSGDTIITLFDADRRQLASNDTSVNVAGQPDVDARLVTRLPAAGRYFVRVHDEATPALAFERGGLGGDRFFVYNLVGESLDAHTDGSSLHEEAGAPPSVRFTAVDLGGIQLHRALLVGALDAPGDEDAFQFSVESEGVLALTAELLPEGSDGNGSTAPVSRVWVTNAAGETVGRIDTALGQDLLGPSLEPGQYRLWVSHQGDSVGENGFYALNAHLQPENPEESFSENDTLLTAEPLQRDEFRQGRSYVLLHLPDGDVDYYSLETLEMETMVTVVCGSSSDGSGLVGLRAEVRDGSDAVLASGTETAASVLSIEDVAVAASETYFLRFTKDSQLEDVIGDWVRCGVFTY